MLSAHILSLETPFASYKSENDQDSDSDWFTFRIDIWLLTLLFSLQYLSESCFGNDKNFVYPTLFSSVPPPAINKCVYSRIGFQIIPIIVYSASKRLIIRFFPYVQRIHIPTNGYRFHHHRTVMAIWKGRMLNELFWVRWVQIKLTGKIFA
jgi:hypothetical protein